MAGQGKRATADERRQRRAELTDPGPVMEAAAAFLAVRPRSVSETRRRLRHLGYPHDLVDGVVGRMAEMGYLDDEAFARAWIESRDRSRPRGQSALRRELVLKGVARETIDAVLDERHGDAAGATADLAAAQRLLERRRTALEREPDPRRRRQKAYTLLARSGFATDDCREAAERFIVGQDED